MKTTQRKIVITGGPAAGKTTVTDILHREFKDVIATVPEAASILFRGGLPRGPSVVDKVFQQRAIYFLQKELENYICQTNPHKFIVCDRGALDGLAYWPTTPSGFFKSLETTEKKELSRYDWVIHLDTAPRNGYRTSHVRKEELSEARAINRKILKVWQNHPQRVVIPNSSDFSIKIKNAIEIIQLILANKPYKDVCCVTQPR